MSPPDDGVPTDVSSSALPLDKLFDHTLDLIPDGELNTAAISNQAGVYLLTDSDDRPILLAYGESIRRLVAGRLATPEPQSKTKRADLAAIVRRIRWTTTFSKFETLLTHWRLARLIYPRTYRKQLGFGPTWFLRVEPEAALPRWTAVKEFRDDKACYIGPIVTRKDADAWIAILEDYFDLCRYYHILERVPHGEPCAYFEMGKCPAPCNGTVSMDIYRRMVSDSIAFTLGDREVRKAALQSAMREAAAALQFEKAVSIRQTLDRAAALVDKPSYRFLGDVLADRWLVLQRANSSRCKPENALIKPFFVSRNCLAQGTPKPLAKIEEALPGWLAQLKAPGSTATTMELDPVAFTELNWLIGRFLFRDDDTGAGCFYRADRIPEASEFAVQVRDYFTRASVSRNKALGPN